MVIELASCCYEPAALASAMQSQTSPFPLPVNGSVSGSGETCGGTDIFDGSVLVFLHGFGPGGVERIALRLVSGWRKHGVKVHLLVGSDTGSMRRELDAPARYELAPAWPLIGRRLKTLRLTVAAWRVIRARRPAVLFCSGNVYAIVAVLLKFALGRHCPVILAKVSNDLIRRDMPQPMRSFYSFWLRLQGQAIHYFAALSYPMSAEVARRMGVPEERVQVLPNPVLAMADIDDQAERKPREAGKRFVAVGRLERQKNYSFMLQTFALSSAKEDSLTIFGEGSERAGLEQLSRELDLAGRVNFAGFSADVRGVLGEYDVLLLSSHYEGQPGALIEALSCGLAIVATRCCVSIPPLLEEGALGALVQPGDVAAFAKAIAAATPGAQDVVRARTKARAFTIERAVPAYLQLFARIAPPQPFAPHLPATEKGKPMKASFS